MNTVSEALELVRSVAPPTPLDPAQCLDRDFEVLLKREDTGPNRAFKWRGALCACEAFHADRADQIVTASTGNHGAAVAWAAKRLGLAAHVVVPENAIAEKCVLIERHGATLHRSGTSLDQASEHARNLARILELPYFEDGAPPAQLLGTETIGAELVDAKPDTVIVPLGCGALAAGIARHLKTATTTAPTILGVQSASFARFSALFHDRPDPMHPTGTTIADGLAENRIVEPAFSICKKHLDGIVTVSDPELLAAMRELWQGLGLLVEPAAAAPLAAMRVRPDLVAGSRVILLTSGGNLDAGLADTVKSFNGVTQTSAFTQRRR